MANIYDRPTATMSGLIFLITSIVLFLGAIGIFIWLLVDAVEEHLIRNILFGAAFLACTLGLLIYVLLVYKFPRGCSAILWCAMVLGAAAFIVGLCMKPKVDTMAGFINPKYQLEYASLR